MAIYNIKTDFGAVGDGVADDAPAFVAAGNAMFANPGSDLNLPAGTYLFGSNASASGRTIGSWATGITGRIIGAGKATTTINMANRCNRTAAIGQYHDGNHFGKVFNVTAGSLSVKLINIADASIFSANQWVLMSGYNIQDIYSDIPNTGYGYPANLTFFEYLQIDTVVGDTITFKSALQKSYLQTWPQLNTGNNFEVNAGGPAGLYALPSDWSQQIEYSDLTISLTSGAQIYGDCRSITYRRCDFPTISAPIPSQNQTFALYSCTSVDNMESDKLVSNFVMDGCDWYRLSFQSSSVDNLSINNTTLGQGVTLTATATTSTSSPTITVSGGTIPSWLVNGTSLLRTSPTGKFGVVTIISQTSTTITFSANASITVNPGDTFEFIKGGLNGAGNTTTITGSTISSVMPGNYAYGQELGPFTISNTDIREWRYGGYTTAVESVGTMSGGVIQIPNGNSWTNAVDNGSGKTRVTVSSTTGYTAGKYIPSSAPYQELAATASLGTGNNTVTFAGGVPAWITNGQALAYSSPGARFPGGTTVSSKTSTTITFSNNSIGAISSGNTFGFQPAALASSPFTQPPGAQILSVVNGTQLDMDLAFPSGFVYTTGGGLNIGGTNGWAVPGSYAYWSGTSAESGIFKILSVTQDSNSQYIQTDAAGGFPTLPKAATGLLAKTVGNGRIRASTLTGTSPHNASLMDARSYNKPPGTLCKLTYNGGLSQQTIYRGLQSIGSLVSITINVSQAYTGSLFSTLFLHLSQFDNTAFIADGVRQNFGFGVDLKTTGTRTILPSNIASNPTKLGSDGALTVPSWTTSQWVNISPDYNLQTTAVASGTVRDISSEASNLWPIVSVEILTDQGVVFNTDPLYFSRLGGTLGLRLRA